MGVDRTIIASIFNKIAMDVSDLAFKHVRLDEDKRFKEVINSSLNYVLTMEPNRDQYPRAFIQDIVMSMFDEGCVAVIPVNTDVSPISTGTYVIKSLRTGKVMDWFPEQVRVRAYDEDTGLHRDMIMPKQCTAIIENPFYAVMNEPNSVLKRLIHKMSLLDMLDDKMLSGKLDLFIHLPYTTGHPTKKQQALGRLDEIERDLMHSPRGIAYLDATEKVTQLNRPAENQLMAEIEYLTSMLYSQLGMPKEVFEGTADEKVMLNYHNRTIEPIATSIVEEMRRKFLTKTATGQGQSIMYFTDPFKFVPVEQIATVSDRIIRNEILTGNEFRGILGFKPNPDPRADVLRNPNMPANKDGLSGATEEMSASSLSSDQAMTLFEELLTSLEGDIDSIIGGDTNAE
jgi:hypothetical protein